MKGTGWNWRVLLIVLLLGLLFLGAKADPKGLPLIFVAGCVINQSGEKKRGRATGVQVVDPDEEQVNQALEKIVQGQLAFVFPDRMIVGHTKRVRIGISKKLSTEQLAELAKFDAKKVEQIEAGTFMEAKLVGDAFKIQSLSTDQQIVPSEGWAMWEWSVTPEKAGVQFLVATLAIRLKLEGSTENRSLPAITKTIEVDRDMQQVFWRSVREMLIFVKDNWKELSIGAGALYLAKLFVF